MKKIILLMLVLASITFNVYSEETNKKHIYVKVDRAIKSRYTSIGANDQEVSAGRVFNIVPTTKKGDNKPTISVEATKDINEKWELGAGVTFLRTGNNVYSTGSTIYSEDFLYSEPAQDGTITTTTLGTTTSNSNFSLSMPRYKSVPLYLTAKYNINPNSKWKFYVKGDLGYSFNKIKDASSLEIKNSKTTLNSDGEKKLAELTKNIEETSKYLEKYNIDSVNNLITEAEKNLELLKVDDTITQEVKKIYISLYEGSINRLKNNKKDIEEITKLLENGTEYKKNIEEKVKKGTITTVTPGVIPLKVRNSVYAGLGLGVEHKNFLAEVSYHKNFVRLIDVNSGKKYKYNNGIIKLSVGYRFDLR